MRHARSLPEPIVRHATAPVNRARRRIALALLAAAAAPAAAQAPSGGAPIRLVVPFAPGGATDLVARLAAERAGPLLGRTIVVENRPGAGGHVGSAAVARAAPDGNTLLLNGTGPLAISTAAGMKLAYDPMKDLVAVAALTRLPSVMVVNAAFPARTLDEFVAHARANPGRLTYGSSAIGNLSHLQAEMLGLAMGTRLVGVAYKGSAPLITDLIGGNVQFAIDNLPAYLPHIESGKLRALAVTSAARSPLLPQVPTFGEAGLQGFDHPALFGIWGPAGLPTEVVARLNDAFNRAISAPELLPQLHKSGLEPVPGTPEQFGARLRAEHDVFERVIRAAGLQLN